MHRSCPSLAPTSDERLSVDQVHTPYTASASHDIDIPDGPGGDSAMVWTLRPEMSGMVHKMITTAYGSSKLPAAEREVARMRIAQLNACGASRDLPTRSVVEAGVSEAMYEHLDEWRTFPSTRTGSAWPSSTRSSSRSTIVRSMMSSSAGSATTSQTTRSSI